MRADHPLAAFALLALIACGGQFPPETPSPEVGAALAAADNPAERITAEEIAALKVPTLYEVVDRLHRTWFRDQLSGRPVTVFSDDDRGLGDAEVLRSIPVRDVKELRHLDARTATLRWPLADGGAIIVVTAR